MFYIAPESPWAVYGDCRPTTEEMRRIRRRLEMTFDIAPHPDYWIDVQRPFREAKPHSMEDSVEGEVCVRSKKWYPGHRLTRVGGVPYGDDVYRPDPEPLEWPFD